MKEPTMTDQEIIDHLMKSATYASGMDLTKMGGLFSAAAERIRVLGEEVEAARRCLTDAALTTPEYNAERKALASGSAMPDDYDVIDEYSEARATTDAARRGA